MSLAMILHYLKTSFEYKYLVEEVKKQKTNHFYGISGSQKSLWAALLVEIQQRPLLYLVESVVKGKEIFDDFVNLFSPAEVQFFPAWESLPFEVLAQSPETRYQRLKVLEGLLSGKTKVVVTTWEAFSKTLLPPDCFRQARRQLKVGQSVELDELIAYLDTLGYQHVERVEEGGQFSRRGGILDIFPPGLDDPYRLEFFDCEIESIRLFSPESQRSRQKVSEIILMPAGEFFILKEKKESAWANLEKEADVFLNKLKQKGCKEAFHNFTNKLKTARDFIEQGNFFHGSEQLLPYFIQEKYMLSDYFLQTPLLIFDEPHRQKQSCQVREKEMREIYLSLWEKGKVLPGQIDNYLGWRQMEQLWYQKNVYFFSLLPQKVATLPKVRSFGVVAKSTNLFLGKLHLLADTLKVLKAQKYLVVILVNSEERIRRLKQGLWDMGLETTISERDLVFQAGQIYLTTGYLTNGFELTDWKIVVFTEHELFYQPKKKAPRRMFQDGKRVTFLEDLQVGDYVVHLNHGIGRYLGIEKLAVADMERDYLVIKYRGDDKLYVPTTQVGLLQKYSYQEGLRPKLSKLGGSEWSKIKSRVKSSVRDLAQDLLKLYAARHAARGFPFAPDTPWQREFEDSFPYEETEDQLQCIAEIKKDMEKPRPMDRLLCGDVGYGKTEVALRAACKTVFNNKQTAVLVPTTILAEQHYSTFLERFKGLPVNINVLSRFSSPKEQREIVEDLKTGKIDIIIGTHRLLSSDIQFKDLGLLVVDEEQRFGVLHKEKIKQLKKTVDVLTLTATPIPRTLQMSMAGVRDMSIIETPPGERYPVQTFVVEYSPQLVQEALRRELGRGGQVYFVHNRVEDIETVATEVQNLVPEAKIGIAHGQMPEVLLENVMFDFYEGHYDVLVCTTIIESGLDIANVNTLIVNQADKLGLSQLYQLRGRVGRSNRVAYAYLTYQKDKVLSEVAEKRLSAIREFTELGSGLKIAMRDLEIRGAGNILGAEQSGQIAAVGFDLYCQLLEQAVREAKGEKEPPEKTVLVDLQVKAYIPQTYIADHGVKVNFYQRINAVKQEVELQQLAEELKDRFGPLPEPVLNLLQIAKIQLAASACKIEAIFQENKIIKIKWEPEHDLTGPALMQLVRRYRRKVSFNVAEGLELKINVGNLAASERLGFLEEIIAEISSLASAEQVLI